MVKSPAHQLDGSQRPIPTPSAGGAGDAVKVLDLVACGGDSHLVVQLQVPDGAPAFYKSTVLVEVTVATKRGDWTFLRPISVQKFSADCGSVSMSSPLGITLGDCQSGFAVPLGAGVTVRARVIMAPAGSVSPLLSALVVPFEYQNKSPAAVKESGYNGIPLNAGPGAGPWIEYGCLPMHATKVVIASAAGTVDVRLVSSDLTTTIIPIGTPVPVGLLSIDPFPAGMHLQVRVPGVTVDRTPCLAVWS